MKKILSGFFLIVFQVIIIICVVQMDKTAPLLITEICNHNDTVAYNDIGLFEDYIELYNDSDVSLNLADFYLSDEKTNTDFRPVADDVLDPGEYIVIFPGDSFSISDGETVYLFDNVGKILDSVEIDGLDTDLVCARDIETLEWFYNYTPTPGIENCIEVDTEEKILEDVIPQFSVEPGFYDTAFKLELSVEGDYDLYYTTDGTEPTCNSVLYTEPILIEDVSEKDNVYSAISEISILDVVVIPETTVNKCNVIRAVAIAEDGAKSRTITGTYFVNYGDKRGYNNLLTVSLVTDPTNLFSKEKGIYVNGILADTNWYALEEQKREELNVYNVPTNYNSEGKGWQRPATVELFDINGERLYQQDVKIGIHGGWSTAFPQKGFNLLLDEYTLSEGDYILSGVVGDKNTSIMLRPGGYRDWRHTQFRDALNQKIMNARDVTVLRAVPCQVFIDGEYWGLYNLQERIDRGLIAQNFGVRQDDVIVLKNSNVVDADDMYYSLYAEMVQYAAENDLSEPTNYKKMEEMIDIQSYIDYYCFQIYVANCDSVANNYSCWRTLPISDKEYYDGKWRWILYDTDDSMGMVEDLAEAETDSFREGHWTTAPMDDTLFSSLMRNSEFKQRFVDTFIEMADTIFEYEYVNELIDEFCMRYKEASILSRQRFRGMDETEEEYLKDVEVIRDFFKRRRGYIMAHMEDALGVSVD